MCGFGTAWRTALTDQKNVKIMGAHTERRLMADHSMLVCDTSSALAAASAPVGQPQTGRVTSASQMQQVACATCAATVQRFELASRTHWAVQLASHHPIGALPLLAFGAPTSTLRDQVTKPVQGHAHLRAHAFAGRPRGAP